MNMTALGALVKIRNKPLRKIAPFGIYGNLNSNNPPEGKTKIPKHGLQNPSYRIFFDF